jgi:hypothetical protein
MNTTYPVYAVRFDQEWQVVFPEDRADIGHMDFWEQTVSYVVVQHYKTPQTTIANLPYSQRRARIVGDQLYYGERLDPVLLAAIRKAVGNDQLAFAYDAHEKRLREGVVEFRKMVRRHRPKSTST